MTCVSSNEKEVEDLSVLIFIDLSVWQSCFAHEDRFLWDGIRGTLRRSAVMDLLSPPVAREPNPLIDPFILAANGR
jgi:hypothetical protein